MSWVKLDDQFYGHPKALELWKSEPQALALWVLALSYSAGHRSDGVVDSCWVSLYCPETQDASRLVAALVDVGLWEIHGDGWRIHDYTDYNPSSTTLNERREQQRAAGKASAAARKSRKEALEQRTSNGSLDVRSTLVGNPVPSRSVPVQEGGSPDVVGRASAALRTVPTPGDEERVQLAEQVRTILQNGIDGVTTDEGCKRPTLEAICRTLAQYSVPAEEALSIAKSVRTHVQSQNRAPNIAGLYAAYLKSASASAGVPHRGRTAPAPCSTVARGSALIAQALRGDETDLATDESEHVRALITTSLRSAAEGEWANGGNGRNGNGANGHGPPEKSYGPDDLLEDHLEALAEAFPGSIWEDA